MTIQQAFPKSLEILDRAVNGEVHLDTQYPMLLSNLWRFYESKGIRFFGDPEDDYTYQKNRIDYDLA